MATSSCLRRLFSELAVRSRPSASFGLNVTQRSLSSHAALARSSWPSTFVTPTGTCLCDRNISRNYYRSSVRPPLPEVNNDFELEAPPLDGQDQIPSKIRDMAKAITLLNFIEMQQLVTAMQEATNISDDEMLSMFAGMGGGGGGGGGAVAAAAEAPAAVAEEPKVVEKTHFTVKIVAVENMDANKFKVIKAIRTIKPGELLEKSKSYITKLPSVLGEEVPKADAEKMKEALEAAGAKIELA